MFLQKSADFIEKNEEVAMLVIQLHTYWHANGSHMILLVANGSHMVS